MQWTRNGDALSGTFVETELTDSGNSTKKFNESFDGSAAGGNVTLTFKGTLGSSANLSGKLEGSNLVLSFPQPNGSIQPITLSVGTVDQYNKDVAQLTGQAQSKAQASASAAADAAHQQKIQTDQAAASKALSALQSDLDVSGALAKISKDATQSATDLQTTRDDAAKGQGGACYGVTTVSYDAANKVGYDVMSSMSYDVGNLKDALRTISSDVAALQKTLDVLSTDGLPTLAGAKDAIAQASATAASATAQANKSIDQGNANVIAAYGVGNSIATGDCAGNGPGDVPAPLAHLG